MMSIGDAQIINLLLGDLKVKKVIFQDTVLYEAPKNQEGEFTTE